jgi:aminopeptidase N
MLVSVLHRAHTRVGYKKNSINLWLTLQATFKITLDVPSDLVALSNMPIAEEKIDKNLKTVSYQESPIMSTYLVAVVVGLFDYVEDHTPDGKIMFAMHAHFRF